VTITLILCLQLALAAQEAATPAPEAAPAAASDQKAALAPPAAPADQHKFTLSPETARIAPGGYIVFTAKPDNGQTLPSDLQWEDGPTPQGFTFTAHAGGVATLTVSEAAADDPEGTLFWVTAQGSGQAATAHIELVNRPGGLISIPVIGFEQVGASSAQSAQKFFLDFFVSRPFPWLQHDYDCGPTQLNSPACAFGPRLRWWGQVRVASYAQQITAGIGEFATGFATQVAQLQVNKVAQAGEFNTGIDVRLSTFPKFFPSIGARGKERTMLSWVAGFGAISPFNPSETLQIFKTPPAGSPQRAPFLNVFPSSANFTYTGFVTPDRDKFFAEYGAGLRLTELFYDSAGLQGTSPAMVTYTLGQNQSVSGGISRGIVQRIEGFFPLPLGERFAENVTTVYLFGRADLRIGAPHQTTPFILEPADASIAGFDPQVNIVAVRSNRDVYTIGVGVDAVKLIKTITLQNSNKQTSKPTAPE